MPIFSSLLFISAFNVALIAGRAELVLHFHISEA